MSKPVLLATLLEKDNAHDILVQLEEKFPKVKFSIIKNINTAQNGEYWKIHAMKELLYEFKETEIKLYCMELCRKNQKKK